MEDLVEGTEAARAWVDGNPIITTGWAAPQPVFWHQAPYSGSTTGNINGMAYTTSTPVSNTYSLASITT